ncbi:hypothetical protein ACH4XT_02450, partial [Streptomyces avidinii]|uniref:hypothetical protein n=1 Tax=Streptomyces avidinii TaxID=1895 RepID=UPI0037A69E99
MTSTRRTDHDRVRQQADDPDPRWPLRGDLAYDTDTATSRTGVVIDVPGNTGTTVYRLCPEGGGEDGWNASLDTLVPTEDAAVPLPRRATSDTIQHGPEHAPWDDPLLKISGWGRWVDGQTGGGEAAVDQVGPELDSA